MEAQCLKRSTGFPWIENHIYMILMFTTMEVIGRPSHVDDYSATSNFYDVKKAWYQKRFALSQTNIGTNIYNVKIECLGEYS